jgi:hypothetical protein
VVAFLPFSNLCHEAKSAPAPDQNKAAKANLAALKSKLPELLKDQLADRNRWRTNYEAKLKSLRQIDSNEAKLTIFLEGANETGLTADREAIFIYLKFHDGIWTTSRFETTFSGARPTNRGVMFLMAEIDELAEKEAGK